MIQRVRSRFKDNTQNLLRLRFFFAPADVTRALSANHVTVDTGMNLLSTGGDAIDYEVGDGPEGEQATPIGRVLEQGWYFGIDADNTDPTWSHTVDVTVDIATLARRGF